MTTFGALGDQVLAGEDEGWDAAVCALGAGFGRARRSVGVGRRGGVRVVPPESSGNLLQHFPGSKDHNVAMREEAVRRGLSISEYGVTNVESGDVFKSAEEDDVYEFLGYQPIPPELRENSGELEAARRGELPELVELRDVRGDLHTHSHWSADGKSTLEESSSVIQLATLYTLLAAIFDRQLWHVQLLPRSLLELWSLVFSFTLTARRGARHLAGRFAPAARCLVH